MGYRRETAEGATSKRVRTIRRVLWTVLALNLAVALAKLGWGYASGSIAMQADGFHSLFDGASNVVGLVGIRLASRPADLDHPYGHSKYEAYASAAIGAMLVFAAYNVGNAAIGELIHGAEPPVVDAISFAVMIGTMSINLAVTLYERHVGKRMNSEILIADASHTASDIWVSLGVIASLIAVRLGYPAADPLIALVVAGAIVYAAWKVFRQAAATLSDAARIPPADIADACMEVGGVLGCHNVRTRGLESEVYVDMHVQVDPGHSVGTAHGIAEEVERAVCHRFDNVADVIVHIEPLDEYQASKTRAEVGASDERDGG
jgi:cation diffusion facilitator family transporter